MSNCCQETVGGHPCELFEPAVPNVHGFFVLYLHGVHRHRLSEQPGFLSLFEEFGLPMLAPETGRSWWVDRICPDFDAAISPEKHILENVLPFIRQRWGSDPPRIALLGTSMGGQGALRLAYKYPNLFPVVAALAPAIDYQIRFDEDEVLQQMYTDEEAVRQDTAILHVHPLNWPRNQFFCCDPADDRWWNSSDRLHMKLSSLGIPHECDLETTGGGHSFEYYNRMAPRAVKFIVDRLDQERRRLL